MFGSLLFLVYGELDQLCEDALFKDTELTQSRPVCQYAIITGIQLYLFKNEIQVEYVLLN
jgi:hypothetical protein